MQSRTSTARKTAPRKPDQGDGQVIELVQPEPEFEEPESKLRPLDEVLAELGGLDGGHVQVRRLDSRGGPPEFVGNYRPEEVTGEASLLQQIQDDFGGGEYLIHVRDGSGFKANRRIKVAERRRAAPDAGASTVAAAVDRMQSQFAQLLQAVVARPQASEGDTEEKVLARMKLMADIVRPQGGQGTDAQALMETLARGIELGQQIAGGGGGGGGGDSTAVMVQSLKTFESLFRSIPPRPAPGARPVRPAAPATAMPAATAEAVPQVAAPEAEDARVTAMRTLLQVVLTGAARNGDPELYAELVADQVGADGVAELLRLPDPVAMLVQFDPAAEQHREWLAELVSELQELQEGADDAASRPKRVDGDPVRAGRGDPDPGADAGAGAQPGRG
jgi:hypothetical protein